MPRPKLKYHAVKPKDGRMAQESAPKARRQCGVEGCPRPEHKRLGVCKEHSETHEAIYTCAHPGCERDVRALGRCFTHYQAQRRRKNGETTYTKDWPTKRPHQLSCRISDECLQRLEELGAKGVVASEILEKFATGELISA